MGATLAQLVEQRFRKAWVVGSTPIGGSIKSRKKESIILKVNQTFSVVAVLLLLFSTIVAEPVFSEEKEVEAIFGKKYEPKFYIGGGMSGHRLGASQALSLDSVLAWRWDQRFSLGFDFGVSFSQTINNLETSIIRLGLITEYRFNPISIINWSTGLRLGTLILSQGPKDAKVYSNFGLLAPEINLNLNLTDSMVTTLGLNYQVAFGNANGIKAEDISGLGMHFRISWFDSVPKPK